MGCDNCTCGDDGHEIARRGVEYGTEMAGIGVGALAKILFPFGEPEWLSSVDPKDFMPERLPDDDAA